MSELLNSPVAIGLILLVLGALFAFGIHKASAAIAGQAAAGKLSAVSSGLAQAALTAATAIETTFVADMKKAGTWNDATAKLAKEKAIEALKDLAVGEVKDAAFALGKEVLGHYIQSAGLLSGIFGGGKKAAVPTPVAAPAAATP